MRRILTAIATAVFLGTTVSVAVAGTEAGGQPPDAKQAAAGRKLYVTYKCDKCHTIAGRGTKKVDGELDSVGAKLTPAEIKKWLTNTAEMEAKLKKPPKGTDAMSNALKTKGIQPEEIDLLVAYLQTLTKK
jgi:cbb3-type cytochrome oxidase cytochrome c subunit